MSKESSTTTGDSKKLQALISGARWSPQPKQAVALARPEFEIGFGGARGGGKTDAGISWLSYDSEQPDLQGAVIRKNATDLEGWLRRAKVIHGDNIRIYGQPAIIQFQIERDGVRVPGATYFTGHLKDKHALDKWVGQNLQRVLLEELNLVPSEEQYESLLASVRSTIPGVRAQVFSTFNPDNVGHTWIKKRFSLAGIPKDPVITKDPKTGRMRIFIPSRVEDNQLLVDNDPGYMRTLEGLRDGLREQWRWGNWDDPVIRGAYYAAELSRMRKDGRICDLPIDPAADTHTWWDIGNDTTSIIFLQFAGPWIHVVDYYQNDSLGLPFYLSKLQEFRENKGYHYGVHHFPHDMDKSEWGTGRNRKETLETKSMDYEIIPRISSKQESIDMSRMLFPIAKIDQHRCAALLDALINYRKEWDDEKQTYKPDPVHDWASHPADAWQGVAMSNWDAIKPPDANSELRKEEKGKEFKDGQKRMRNSDEYSDSRNKGRFNYDE